GEILVHTEFAGLQLREQRRVVFVNDLVGGQVFTAKRQRLDQGCLPDGQRLAGNREHEVEVQIVETGPAQDVERLKDHFARVDPAQPVEQRFVERLHAHRDAVDAEIAEQFRLVGGYGGRVAFDGEFGRAQQFEPFQGAQDLFPLAEIQQGRRAAAEEDGLRFEIAGNKFHFAAERGCVAVDEVTACRLRIKGAIRAFLRAKGNVNI